MSANKNWNFLATEQTGKVLTVRFDSGTKLNTFTPELMAELTELARGLEDDTELRAVILTGRTDIFTGGADIKQTLSVSPESLGLSKMRKFAQAGPRMCEAWERVEAITIAAIEGHCIGAGVALAAAFDLRITGESAVLYTPEIERGISMSWHSIPRTVALVGPARAKRIIAIAEKIHAKTALDWGLVDEIATDGNAYQKALEMANKISDLPPIPVRMSKQAINATANALLGVSSYMDADQLLLTLTSEDFQEALAAFMEKRKPNYTGR